MGRFDLASIQISVSLLSAANTKKAVIQEIEWFNSKKMTPNSVVSSPSAVSINNFKSLIFNHSYSKEFGKYSMSPAELSRICCKRYIAGDHVSWITKQLNKQQSDVLCIYINSVINIKAFVERTLKKRTEDGVAVPIKVAFVINVGKNPDGSCFIGSDLKQGNHWSTCIYDCSDNTLIYGDSLGWSTPAGLEKVNNYLDAIYPDRNNTKPCLKECHDSSLTDLSGRHKCDPSLCCSLFPLQTCSNICGVVALVVVAICCLNPTVYEILTSVQLHKRPYIFLQEPSKYNKYLRLCLLSWFSEENINIDYVVPNTLENMNEVSDSDEDEEIERLDEAIIKSIEKNQKVKKNQPKVTIAKTKDKTSSCFTCGHGNCKSTFTRRNDLKRHILKFHEENVMEAQSGNCLCTQCGQQFHRIVDLRTHRINCHDIEFRTEILDFDNKAGKI